MKIAHIVCTYPPYYGGMGNVVFQTAGELSELGHEVEVLTPGFEAVSELTLSEKEREEAIDEKQDFARRLKPKLSYGNAAWLPQISRQLDAFDLVHLHYPFFGTAYLVSNWKKKNPNKPLVITYHMDTRGFGLKGLFFNVYSRYWMPKILKTADKLIGSTLDYIKVSDASEIYNSSPKKWVELPFGVDTERFTIRRKPEALLNRHNLDENKLTLLFVGGMDDAHNFKGVPVFLQALKIINSQTVDWQAIFVGEGNLKEKFEIQSSFMKLNGNVVFTGRVSNEELPYYYNLADLFVLPSTSVSEAFGMVLLEAMASGVPVIASDLPGVREVGGRGGRLVLPGDADALAQEILGYLLMQDLEKSRWKEQVRGVVLKNYTWKPITKRLEEVYLDLI